jgi:hypothetical protein
MNKQSQMVEETQIDGSDDWICVQVDYRKGRGYYLSVWYETRKGRSRRVLISALTDVAPHKLLDAGRFNAKVLAGLVERAKEHPILPAMKAGVMEQRRRRVA